MHRTRRSCSSRGRRGAAVLLAGTTRTPTRPTSASARAPSDRVKRSVLLHELSHAWAEHHVSDQARERIRALRGPQLKQPGDGWGQRATEHAAVIMAWGLADGMTNVHMIGDVSANALARPRSGF